MTAVAQGAKVVRDGDRTESLVEQAYSQLRTAIITGDLRPNQRLVEVDLAGQFGFSRTPIRTGLQRLEADGMVTKQRSSWTVREFSVPDIREVYQVRSALEGYAARLAASQGTAEEFARIDAMLDSHGKRLADLVALPHREQVQLNTDFHSSIAEASHNQHLIALIRKNREFYFDERLARLWSEEEYMRGHAGHSEILKALRDRDGDAAERLTREHFTMSLDVIVAKIV